MEKLFLFKLKFDFKKKASLLWWKKSKEKKWISFSSNLLNVKFNREKNLHFHLWDLIVKPLEWWENEVKNSSR